MRVQAAGQLGPMGMANGAGDTTMTNIGGDASKVESMRALSIGLFKLGHISYKADKAK
jgi:hypothetical protein